MKAYVRVRQECEEILRESGLACTILRPWYVLGPGHPLAGGVKTFLRAARKYLVDA
jgi:uncharacterized protein YbjT (DUF2867 family)